MMSIKMSDEFGECLTVREIDLDEFNSANENSDGFFVIEDSKFWCCSNKEHIEYAIEAINAYDSNQSLIASQAETITDQTTKLSVQLIRIDNQAKVIRIKDDECDRLDDAVAAQAETIAKQQEQIELLREAVSDFVQVESEYWEDTPEYAEVVVNLSEALAATGGE